MTTSDRPDHERVEGRAGDGPPEEGTAVDAERQAAAILAESDERSAGGGDPEHRTSDEATEP